MESCELCGQTRSPEDSSAVRCSGPCGGTVHARCATFSGGITLTTSDGLFWFCDRCRRGLRPVGNTTQQPDLPELPTEIWIEVFRNLPDGRLPKVRLVCRRWRDIVDDCPALLAKITVAFCSRTAYQKVNPDRLLPVTKASFISIKRIGSWWHSFGPGLTEIKIEHFEMERFHLIELSDLLGMLRHTPNLRRFALIGCILNGKRSGRPDFRLNKLETLILEDILDLAKYLKVFRKLFSKSPVKALKITWSDSAGYTAAAESDEMTEMVADFQTTLDVLTVNCSDIFLSQMMSLDQIELKKLTLIEEGVVDNSLLMDLFECHRSLEYVDISDMMAFNEENAPMLIKIGQLLPKLQFLSIFATHVDISFLSKTPKLQTFKLYGVERGVKLIQSSWFHEKHQNLKQLDLSFIEIPATFAQQWFATLPNLRILSLTSCKIGCWSDFLAALQSLELLEMLSLDMIEAVETGPSPSPNKPLTRLRYLKCSTFNEISDDAFGALLEVCSSLRELKLVCVLLGEAVLSAICRNLPQLRKLTMVTCAKSNVMKSYIRQHCRSLEELKLE
ncbi:hypothetical protein pipiens_011107 [Culex pipiens pipiens]|uniref:F-box domain-containing protein n=1 Tax=Culex pipiens pipiens TaxID=38569 RepID=A0ABD1D7M3_CULPP